MRHLFILTSAFPYEGGEQFLETEIKFWDNTRFYGVWIIPSHNSGKIRNIPNKIKVLSRKLRKSKTVYVLLSLINPILYKEIYYILNNIKLKHIPSCLIVALRSTALTLKDLSELKDVLKEFSGNEIVLYSYWNDISSYAGCILKRQGIVSKVVSRAHGFDLYKERRHANYMPLKRQFVNDYDAIYLLAESAYSYYKHNYQTNFNKLNISKLGVLLPSKIKQYTPNINEKKILSISNCIPIKQINLILEAVKVYAYENPSKTIQWTHIGHGPLFQSLKLEAKRAMTLHSNLVVKFTGQLENIEVKSALATNSYDLIINASTSEGVPVSIMEAMSFGIPAIAPNIGGVAELVNNDNGYLMPSVCTKEDIVYGINHIYDNHHKLRQNAYNWIVKNFNASLNYQNFITQLELL